MKKLEVTESRNISVGKVNDYNLYRIILEVLGEALKLKSLKGSGRWKWIRTAL